MVLAAKQRSLYELTDAISSKDRVRALEMLDALLSAGDGEEAAIGHLYMLAKTFRQMLVILERNVRDQRMLWAALWQGFRVPPFAADDIIRQARRYKSKRELTRAIRLVAKADLALRSNPPGKRMVLERLILDLASEPKPESCRRMDAGRTAGVAMPAPSFPTCVLTNAHEHPQSVKLNRRGFLPPPASPRFSCPHPAGFRPKLPGSGAFQFPAHCVRLIH